MSIMSRPRDRGFTIVELLIVVVVVAILAAISVLAYNGIQNRAKNAAVSSEIANNVKKIEEYRAINGKYPRTGAEFQSANMKFTRPMYGVAIYCEKGGEAQPQYAFVVAGKGGDVFAHTSDSGRIAYTAAFDSGHTVCGRVGLSSPNTSIWLYNGTNWSFYTE